MIVAACAGGSATTTAVDSNGIPIDQTTTTAPASTSTSPPVTSPSILDDFPRTTIEINGEPYFVAVAEGPAQLQQGLMFVEDLGPLDGMLFIYGSEDPVSHWMQNTLIPLDIAYFDAAGRLVNWTSMLPCEVETCPTYPSAAPAQYAVEVPAGTFDELPEDSTMAITGRIDRGGKEI